MEFNSPFYPGMVSAAEQKEIQLSKLWPVVLSLHHNYGLYASCLQQTTHGSSAQKWPMVIMSVKSGLPVISVKDSFSKSKRGRYDTSKPRTILVSTANVADYENEELVQSNNTRYVISKVSNDDEISNRIEADVATAEIRMQTVAVEMTREYTQASRGNMEVYAWELSDVSQLSLVHMWEGSRKKEDLLSIVATECEKVIQMRDARAAHLETVIEGAKAMFDKPKWFTCWSKQGWVIGAHHMTPLAEYARNICNNENFNSHTFTDIGREILPFRLYKSVDSLSPEDATAMKATLATNKMYIKSNLPSVGHRDDEGLFPSGHGTQICADIGLVMHNMWWMLIDKW